MSPIRRLLHSTVVVLVVCAGARIAAWLVAPVLPMLGFLVATVIVIWLLLNGPRMRDRQVREFRARLTQSRGCQTAEAMGAEGLGSTRPNHQGEEGINVQHEARVTVEPARPADLARLLLIMRAVVAALERQIQSHQQKPSTSRASTDVDGPTSLAEPA